MADRDYMAEGILQAGQALGAGLQQRGLNRQAMMQADMQARIAANKDKIAQGQKMWEQMQQDREQFFKHAGNKDFPKSVRMNFYNNGVAIDKQLGSGNNYPAIDAWDEKVGDVLDAFGVIDSMEDIDQKTKMRMKTQLIAQQQKIGGNLEQSEFLRSVMDTTAKAELPKEDTTSVLSNLGSLYKQLQTSGGIVDTTKSATENVTARLRSSAAGQMVEGAMGTKTQSVRNQINQSRPLLINAIRKATEMGARGLDSEKELEFYLQAATDPTKDVQSNLQAIQVLDQAYGLGLGIGAPQQQTPPPPAGIQPGAVEDGYRFKGGNPADQTNWEKVN